MTTKIYYNDKDNKIALVEELNTFPVKYKLLKLGKWYKLNEQFGSYGPYNMQLLGYNLVGVYYETELANEYI